MPTDQANNPTGNITSPAAWFAPWVEWQQETCAGGRQLITAVNHRTGTALYLSPGDLEAVGREDIDNPNARELHDGGFLAGSTVAAEAPAVRSSLSTGIVWSGAHRFVQRSYTAGLRRLFRPGWIVAQTVLAVAGAIAVAHVTLGQSMQLRATPAQIPAIIVLGLVAVAIHELGHALVTVHHGRRVRAAGLRLHLGSPTFYVDSVDALLLTRRQRIVQAAAGPWAEWLANSAASLLLLVVPAGSAVGALLHRFVIVNAIGIAINLLPFVGLDGSLLLGDIIREPDLLARTRAALVAPRALAYRDRWIIAYALTNATVAGALLVTAVYFWWQLFGGLIEVLLGLGPVGVALLSVVAAALIGQVARSVAPTVEAFRHTFVRGWATVAFRMQRRWRVRAIRAFRVIPDIAELDAATLGVLAGHLQRLCYADIETHTERGGHIYLERKRAIVPIADEPPGLVARNTRCVLLPSHWRQLAAA